jgi:hypothetical protein
MKGFVEESENVLIKLHKDPSDPTDSFAKKEYLIMKAQIDLEAENPLTLREAFRSKSLRKRFILGALTMSGTQFSGLIVILSELFRTFHVWVLCSDILPAYQQVIYASLGFKPFMIGVMSGIWCTLNGTGNFVGALIIDKVGRVRQMS